MKKFMLIITLLISSLNAAVEENMELLISSQDIQIKIAEVAAQLNQDYKDRPLTILMVMKGAVCVTADLIRHLDVPFKLEYVKASSYGYNGMEGRELTLEGFDSLEIEGRDILVVDDIFETGNTMLGVMEKIQEKQPKSVKSLLLLVKDIPRKTTYRPDYILFDIQDRFVIGYGLDYKELYRGLPGIYAFIHDDPGF